jgi:hypothetical protein
MIATLRTQVNPETAAARRRLMSKRSVKIIDTLFQSLSMLTPVERAQVLNFWMGSSRVPAGGFANVTPQPLVVVLETNVTDDVDVLY